MRIISGSARGRQIAAPPGLDTRPTLDRIRTKIFDTIQFIVPGKDVLDLFAGSGAMGLEALSRGAKAACFVDKSRVAADVVRKNISTLGFGSRCLVKECDYFAALEGFKSEKRQFDIIFMDPPYEM